MTSRASSADLLGLIDKLSYPLVAIEHLNDAIVITDKNGRILWVNQAFETLTGYLFEEVISKKPGDLLQGENTDPDDIKKFRRAIDEDLDCSVQILNYTKEGKEYWAEINLHAIKLEGDEVEYYVAIERDVTEERNLFERARDLAAYQQALDRQAIVSVADRSGRITYVNENFCTISGYAREELMGRTHRVVNSAHHDREFFIDMWRDIARGRSWRGEVCNKRRNGDLYWVDTTIVPVLDDSGKPARFVSIRYDITEKKRAESELRRLADHDVLTSLANRDILTRELEALAAQSLEDPEAGGLFVLIDLDHFKDINDTWGHDVGDEVLMQIAERLRRMTRARDLVARLGGDEFAMLLRDIGSASRGFELVDSLQQRLTAPTEIRGQVIEPTFSMGVARFPEDGGTATDIMKRADIALYEAKKNGRAHWRLFDPANEETLASRHSMLAKLSRAIEADEIDVALQPQFVLQTGALRGFEALVRWRSDGRTVPPSAFIPIAEETRLIGPLGAAVLSKALAAQADLSDAARRTGLAPAPLVISVNAAPRQLRDPAFVALIETALRDCDAAATHLEIELTETALIGPMSEKVAATLTALKALGVSIALDDFGTGYSSLSHLKNFPVDVLKIDKSFVRDIETDPHDARLVSAIISLCREMQLTCVAEGVETTAQRDFLHTCGCDLVQGYYYAPPLDPAAAADFIASGAEPAAAERAAPSSA
ncbi:MAG: EAL domain-containing protein [Pseudomonadota bacterium]